MGWWNAPDQPELVVGDAVLDSVRHFLKDFSREYQEDLSRKPTLQELEYALSLAFKVNVDDDILANFEELEVKQVLIKTAKRPKRQKPKPGDIFAFKLGDGRFGFGRLVSTVSVGMIAEIFDYFASQPVFDYSKLGKWLIPPRPIDSFTLLERGKEGDWRIIGHTPDYVPGPEFASLRYVYGAMPHMLKAVDIYDQEQPISAVAAEGLLRYSPCGDFNIKKAVSDYFSKKEINIPVI
jgi:Immunity protein 26